VTHDPQDRAEARSIVDALHLLCNVSGQPGLLARAAWPKDRPKADDGGWHESPDGLHLWRDDVSSDQMTGVYYGFFVAHELAATDEDKARIAADVAALTDHLIEHEWRIVDVDGETTQWGRYWPEYVRTIEPMNAMLLLQHLKVAAHITGEARFTDAYQRLGNDEGYFDLAVKARRSIAPRRINHSDDVLIFLGYYPLLSIEQDPAIRTKYIESLRRTWNGNGEHPGVAPEANPFFAFIGRKFLGEEVDVEPAVNTLRWFPLDMKWNRDTIADYEHQFGFTFDPLPQSPQPEEGAPVPIDRRGRDWSTLVQNPYRSGIRTLDQPVEFNGHDYLAAYWLGRYTGFLEAE
jgi:hypothetical protein